MAGGPFEIPIPEIPVGEFPPEIAVEFPGEFPEEIPVDPNRFVFNPSIRELLTHVLTLSDKVHAIEKQRLIGSFAIGRAFLPPGIKGERPQEIPPIDSMQFEARLIALENTFKTQMASLQQQVKALQKP
jgi:hypothetical protein